MNTIDQQDSTLHNHEEGPLISICIPAYKAERYLQETLDSVRRQTYTNWELLVVIDGSTDRTESIVEAFRRELRQPVRIIKHETNQGLPATRNTGIMAAKGEWLALLDADDLWTSNHLAQLRETQRESQADLIHSGVVLFDSDSGTLLEERIPSSQAKNRMPLSVFDGSYLIQPSSTLIRTSMLLKLGGFDQSFRSVEDREFWIRFLRNGGKIAFQPEITCHYRQHAAAMTKQGEIMSLWAARCLDKHSDWNEIPGKMRRSLTAEAWVSAGRIVLRSKPALAREHFGRALKIKTLSPKTTLYWLLAAILAAI